MRYDYWGESILKRVMLGIKKCQLVNNMASEKCAVCGIEGTPWASLPGGGNQNVCQACCCHPMFWFLEKATSTAEHKSDLALRMARAIVAMDLYHSCEGKRPDCSYCEAKKILAENGEMLDDG